MVTSPSDAWKRTEIGTGLRPTSRQYEILGRYIRLGSIKAAAHSLRLSTRTVQTQLGLLRSRVGAHNEAQAVHLIWVDYMRHIRRCTADRHALCPPIGELAAFLHEVDADL